MHTTLNSTIYNSIDLCSQITVRNHDIIIYKYNASGLVITVPVCELYSVANYCVWVLVPVCQVFLVNYTDDTRARTNIIDVCRNRIPVQYEYKYRSVNITILRLPFRRRYFECFFFLHENILIALKVSPKFVPKVQINDYSAIGSDNDFVPIRRQAIIWNNDG